MCLLRLIGFFLVYFEPTASPASPSLARPLPCWWCNLDSCYSFWTLWSAVILLPNLSANLYSVRPIVWIFKRVVLANILRLHISRNSGLWENVWVNSFWVVCLKESCWRMRGKGKCWRWYFHVRWRSVCRTWRFFRQSSRGSLKPFRCLCSHF